MHKKKELSRFRAKVKGQKQIEVLAESEEHARHKVARLLDLKGKLPTGSSVKKVEEEVEVAGE